VSCASQPAVHPDDDVSDAAPGVDQRCTICSTGARGSSWAKPTAAVNSFSLTPSRRLKFATLRTAAACPRAKYALHNLEVSDLFGARGRVLLRQRLNLLPPCTAYATQQLLEQVENLDRQVRGFEHQMQTVFRPTPTIQLLLTLPGVGLMLAVVIALEVGSIARFATAEKLAAYAGTAPRVHASGGKTRFGLSRPDVNRYLKWAFVEAANAIWLNRRRAPRRHVSRLYERVARRKGHQKAIGAVARHLAEATYWILAKQEAYREPNAATVSSTGDKRG
jgi:hypothetical protein